MKTIKDKQVLVGADFAGFPLKEAVVRRLKSKGWTVTDIGVKSADDPAPEMFHRIGLKAGAKIAEGKFERALEPVRVSPEFIGFSDISPV